MKRGPFLTTNQPNHTNWAAGPHWHECRVRGQGAGKETTEFAKHTKPERPPLAEGRS